MRQRISPVDVVVGTTWRVVRAAARTAHTAGSVLEPVTQVLLHPPIVPMQLQPAGWLAAVARDGADQRASLREELARRLDVLVPVVLAEVLQRAHLTDLVLEYVDLDRVVGAVDLDAAAARLDVESVVGRVDLDAVARRIDVDAVAARIDLDKVVRRVDVDAIVDRVDAEAVVGKVDLDSIVSRVDLDAAARRLDIDSVLDRLDLTSVVLERVDLEVLVQAVLDRIDLIKLAEEVIDGVDLPEIIRESTGSMASDTVRGVRMQGIVADEAVGRAVDRLLLRRGRRATQAPADNQDDRPAESTFPTQRDRRG
ncbi:MAG TPA: hypothetical protein VF165_16750 [Nocardioidaceae bacterium]